MVVVRNLNLCIFYVCSHLLTWTAIHNLSLLSLGLQLISVNAESVNASEGTEVRFACQTSFSQTDVTLDVIPVPSPNDQTISLFDLPGGGQEIATSFIATAALNETMIECRATNEEHTEVGPPALLLVQGKGSLRIKLTIKSVNVFQVPPLV